MKLKRLFSAIAAVMLVLSLHSPALADESVSLEEQLTWACTYGKKVDISAHKIKQETLKTTFDTLYNNGLLPWYCDSSYSFEYDQDTGRLISFSPMLVEDPEETVPAYEEIAAQILAKCIKPGMSQYQMALALHDYLAVNFGYDDTLSKHDPDDLLVGGSAVCSGYARAYQDLLRRVGIESQYVSSEAMDHAWNLVKIDGNWYHVDVTWDDPTPNTEGLVHHSYFLRTDAEMTTGEKPHHDWNSTTECTDTRFSDAFWVDVESAIWYEDADTCYLIRSKDLKNTVCRRNERTGRETRLYSEPEDSSVNLNGDGNYFYSHHGLTLRGDRLWFCSLDKILTVKTDGSGLKTEHQNSGNTYLYGCFATEEILYVTRSTHEGKQTLQKFALTATDAHQCSFQRQVIDPTDEDEGYTLSVCEGCDLTVKSLPTPALENAEANAPESDSEKKPALQKSDKSTADSFRIDPTFLGAGICVGIFVLIRLIFRKK